MTNDIDFTKMDFETALRVAKQRGMAERSNETRRIFGSLFTSVRDLFSAPASSAKTDAC